VPHSDVKKHTALIQEVTAVRNRLHTKNRWVLSPNDKTIRRWDLVTFAALLFTAVVTPAEVAFLDPKDNWPFDALFWINRVVDFVFMCDIAPDGAEPTCLGARREAAFTPSRETRPEASDADRREKSSSA